MSDCDEFYRRRDLRTRAYTRGELYPNRLVVVGTGRETIRREAGQFLLLTLANLLARVHRRVAFVLPDSDIETLVDGLPGDGVLGQELLDVAEEIDPCGDFTVRKQAPATDALKLGVGAEVPGDFSWYVGARGSIALLGREPASVDDDFGRGTMRGAGLAACLAASVPFQEAHELPLRPRRISTWNYREGEDASLGPSSLDVADPGRVLMVGAGAVGSSLAYWLRTWGTKGEWTVVDPDFVKLHNTNRGLLFVPPDAGWIDGRKRQKCNLVADALPTESEAVDQLYRHAEGVQGRVFDVVLPLANEDDVRAQLAGRNATVMLHATTGRNYVSQLHRHVKGRDDCLACRMGNVAQAALRCSTVEVELDDDEEVGDAALPYLSAASGLMLATALQRLSAGELTRSSKNCWSWYFKSERRMVQGGRRTCREECSSVLSGELRRAVAGDRMWTDLDPAIE